VELCPQCFKPLTQYWNTVLIEPFEDKDTVILTMERSCKCGYKEEDQVEQLKSIACISGCGKCVAKCDCMTK